MNGPEATLTELAFQLQHWKPYFKSGFAMLAFVALMFFPYSVSNAILILRHISLVGVVMIICAIWMPSLDVIGDFVFWPSFALTAVVGVFCQWPAMKRELKNAPPAPEKMMMEALVKSVTNQSEK